MNNYFKDLNKLSQLSYFYEYLGTGDFSYPTTPYEIDQNVSLNRVSKKVSYVDPNKIKEQVNKADIRIKEALNKRKEYIEKLPKIGIKSLKQAKLKQLNKSVRQQIESYINAKTRENELQEDIPNISVKRSYPILPKKLKQKFIFENNANDQNISPLI